MGRCGPQRGPQAWAVARLAAPSRALTLLPHPSLLALAQPALLALASHEGVHLAGSTAPAGVAPGPASDHAAPEEALAAFTAEHVVVEAGGLVPAHAAQLVAQHLWSRALLTLALWLLRRVWDDWGGRTEATRESQKQTGQRGP